MFAFVHERVNKKYERAGTHPVNSLQQGMCAADFTGRKADKETESLLSERNST